MKKKKTSTADFVISFAHDGKSDSLDEAFFETQEQIGNTKTQIELEVMDEFVAYFFESAPEKRHTLSTQIHYKMEGKRNR